MAARTTTCRGTIAFTSGRYTITAKKGAMIFFGSLVMTDRNEVNRVLFDALVVLVGARPRLLAPRLPDASERVTRSWSVNAGAMGRNSGPEQWPGVVARSSG